MCPAEGPLAKATLPRPDKAYIMKLKASLETHFSSQDEQIDEMRRVRTLQDPVRLPPELQRVAVEVRDPTVADEVARVVATLTLNPPTCKVTPTNQSDAAQANSTLREEWTEQVLQWAGTRIPGEDTMRDIVDAAVADGGAWWKLLFDPDRWETRFKLNDFSAFVMQWLRDHPEDIGGDDPQEPDGSARRLKALRAFTQATEDAKKIDGPPITWLAVDARTVYPVFQGGSIVEVLEVSERPTVQTLRQYGLSLASETDGSYYFTSAMGLPLGPDEASVIGPTVHFIEHWDNTWCTYLIYASNIGSHQLTQFEHGYGRVPYFYAPGIKPNHWKGRKVGWGVSQTKRWLVQFRSFLYTLLAQSAAQDVGQPIAEEITDPAAGVFGESNRPITHEQWPLNGMIHLPPGHKLQPVFNRPVAQSFTELLSEVSNMISILDTPRVNSQIGSGMEGAGFAIAQVLMEAKTRHNPFVANIQRALGETSDFLWHLVRTKIQETVYVRSADPSGKRSGTWLGMGPEDLKDACGVEWRLDPEQPSAKIIESRYWTERINNGTASLDMAIEAMGDNPDVVRLGRMMDEARHQQWYQQWLYQEALQLMGRGDILQEQALQAAQTGVLPGMPPGMQQQLMAQQQAMGGSQPGGGPPDMAALAMTPNGAGAQGVPMSGSVSGVGPGAVLPAQGGQAMVQRIGG